MRKAQPLVQAQPGPWNVSTGGAVFSVLCPYASIKASTIASFTVSRERLDLTRLAMVSTRTGEKAPEAELLVQASLPGSRFYLLFSISLASSLVSTQAIRWSAPSGHLHGELAAEQRKDRMTIDNLNTIRVLITGGAGFLGTRLARTILQRGHLSGRPIAELVLADLVPPPPDLARDPRVRAYTGALMDQCETLRHEPFDVVFHLAGAVSAECEADLDLGLRSNLDTTRALLDALRAGPGRALSSPVPWLSSAAMSTCRCRG